MFTEMQYTTCQSITLRTGGLIREEHGLGLLQPSSPKIPTKCAALCCLVWYALSSSYPCQEPTNRHCSQHYIYRVANNPPWVSSPGMTIWIYKHKNKSVTLQSVVPLSSKLKNSFSRGDFVTCFTCLKMRHVREGHGVLNVKNACGL